MAGTICLENRRKSSKSLNYDILLIIPRAISWGFPPLNTVYTELELDESVPELMTVHEVHNRGD
jgi:hypothetical protein